MKRLLHYIPVFVFTFIFILFFLEKENVYDNFFSPEYNPYIPQDLGTGFYINKSNIITNEHVVRDCNFFRVVEPYYARSKIKLLSVDKKNDLAVLSSPIPPKKIPYLVEGLEVDDSVFVIGYPGGIYDKKGALVVEPNYIGNRYLKELKINFIENKIFYTDSVAKGNSGGPLLDKTAKVVGVIDAYIVFQDPRNNKEVKYGSAVHISRLTQFLNKLGIEYNTDYGVASSYSGMDYEGYANSFIVKIKCV